jgi:GT2 family glycosyltransferase
LAALSRQQVPPAFRWELLVVDNNSKDATSKSVELFRQSRPDLHIKYLFEKEQGLSHARNKGISVAQGEFVVFTDDDVLPEPDWLAKLVACMREYDCAAAGGFIEPLWLADPPRWLTERFYGFLALRTDPEGPKEAHSPEEMPFGASLAFAKRIFDEVGVFDPQLGRKGNVLAGGEEIDVLMRIIKHGGRVMYFPHVRVRHKVEAFRVSKRYFRRWRYQGSMNAAATWSAPSGRQIAGVPLYLFLQLIRATWRSICMRLMNPADEAFRQEMIVWHFLGLIHGLMRRDQR